MIKKKKALEPWLFRPCVFFHTREPGLDGFLTNTKMSTLVNTLTWLPDTDGWFSLQGHFPYDKLIVRTVPPLCLAPLLWRLPTANKKPAEHKNMHTKHRHAHLPPSPIDLKPALTGQVSSPLLLQFSSIQLRAAGETCSSGSRHAAGAVRQWLEGEEFKENSVITNCLVVEFQNLDV